MDRILVVEDDRELNQGICFALQQAGYETESAYSTQEAKLAGLQQEYSLMILDVNLPDGEGFGFCKWIMEHRKVKVMFLTARDLEEDVLSGYELGAEDYVTKPFSIHILLKKIAVILKREFNSHPRFPFCKRVSHFESDLQILYPTFHFCNDFPVFSLAFMI